MMDEKCVVILKRSLDASVIVQIVSSNDIGFIECMSNQATIEVLNECHVVNNNVLFNLCY